MKKLTGFGLFAFLLVSAQTVYSACRELDVADGASEDVVGEAAADDLDLGQLGHARPRSGCG